MAKRRDHSRGFSLVELMVVIGIIGVLIGMLLPAVHVARDRAVTLECASNLRQVGMMVRLFAHDHDDRGPGRAHAKGSGDRARPWNITLSRYFEDGPAIQTRGELGNTNDPVFRRMFGDRRMIGCPAAGSSGSADTRRTWTYNAKAAGDFEWTWGEDIEGYEGEFGRLIEPPESVHEEYAKFSLGARLSLFRRPSEKILIGESERGNDYWRARGPWDPAGAVTLGTDPPWASIHTGPHGGDFAFRHGNFSYGNFLFVDGHVEALRPTDDINPESLARYGFD